MGLLRSPFLAICQGNDFKSKSCQELIGFFAATEAVNGMFLPQCKYSCLANHQFGRILFALVEQGKLSGLVFSGDSFSFD